MKREIKFRGIDAISNEMVYGDLIHGVGHKEGSLYILPRVKNLAYVKNCDPLDGVKIINGTESQFTGLKDKNGVDIYEGDILSGYPHGNSIVKWDDEYGCWHSGFDLIGNEIKDMPEREVIGNIHQNPELI